MCLKQTISPFVKKKCGIVLIALILLGCVLLFCTPSNGNKGHVIVTFLSLTNVANGNKFALFSAANDTKRLYVRGRSEIEMHDGLSNQITLVQITNVDYLQLGQKIFFALPQTELKRPWRLKFTYVDTLSPLENLKADLGWFLYRHGIRVSVQELPHHDIRELTTEWIKE